MHILASWTVPDAVGGAIGQKVTSCTLSTLQIAIAGAPHALPRTGIALHNNACIDLIMVQFWTLALVNRIILLIAVGTGTETTSIKKE